MKIHDARIKPLLLRPSACAPGGEQKYSQDIFATRSEEPFIFRPFAKAQVVRN